MITSSMSLGHSLNSQESPSGRPELQREHDRLKLLHLTNTLVSNLECRDVLRTVVASIRQLMHCDFVGVWLSDVEHVYLGQLAIDFVEGKGFAKEDALQPIGGSVMGTVFKTGKPVVLDHISGQLAPDEATEVCAEALSLAAFCP